jgi:hypothetical protein
MNLPTAASRSVSGIKTIGLLVMMACCSLVGAPPETSDSPRQPAGPGVPAGIPTGPDVFGVFDGRSPCQEIASQLNVPTTAECIKIKWRLILFQDPVTHTPTSYTLEGFVFRNPPKTGKWAILRGADPGVIVYQLDPSESGGFLSFIKGDENILFFLDKNQNYLLGNMYFSYTLNRVISP